MKQVAKLISFSLLVRVVVPENATEAEIVKAAKFKVLDKIYNDELQENIEEIKDDLEMPHDNKWQKIV